MRVSIASVALLLAACSSAESVDLAVRFGSSDCPDVDRRCAIERRGKGLLVYSAAPSANDPEPLAPSADMLSFYGEVRTASGATAVIEIAYDDSGAAKRLRYREVAEGKVSFRGQVTGVRGRAGVNDGSAWTFSFVAVDAEGDQPARFIAGAIRPVGVVVAGEPGAPSESSGGCGGDVIIDDPINYPPSYPSPVPDPDPVPDPVPLPDPDPVPDPDPDPVPAPDPWSTPPTSSSDGCEGDTGPDTSSSGGGCEGDTTTPASGGGGCEGDTSSSGGGDCDGGGGGSSAGSSAAGGCSDCSGGDVAAASCAPIWPLERIFLSLFRLSWPVTLAGWWNRRSRKPRAQSTTPRSTE